ncbi:MAG: DUF2325 domain-containing protein [Thermodesulfobacteriota bacterium]
MSGSAWNPGAGNASKNVVLVGGMDRLESRYVEEAGSRGIDLKVFNGPAANLPSRIGNAGALILFTNRVSHRARREVMSAVRSRNIPVLHCRSCGICSFRTCLECLAGRRPPAVSPTPSGAPAKGLPAGRAGLRAPRKAAPAKG